MKYRLFAVLSLCALISGCGDDPIVFEVSAEDAPAENSMVLPDQISFNEHIQPILSEYCYHCHGPDAGTRHPEKEPLRLDIEGYAFEVRDFGAPVIIKGKPEESELVKLIRSKDIGDVMPPPESHKTMGEREIALLEKWIEQGAEYEGHWSYQPVVRSEAPQNDWSEKPIDGFIFEKLAEAGLKPNPAEDTARFHRRLSFDITGLPPEPTETEAFVKAYENDAEAAVSDEADRMLKTMASAENFARHWLDAARYADTHGIHIDNYRAIWPYRDWVVRSFHENKKWDVFTTEQLAGDLLPEPSLDQKVATGFLRSLATTGEGGAIEEEYDSIYANDRVDTMGGIWLGLTASCAACHDHKFDPFSTKEFYQLTSFFRNNTMTALDKNNAEHAPAIFVPHLDDRAGWESNHTSLANVETRINKRKAAAQGDFQQWLASASQSVSAETDSTLAIHLPLQSAEGNLTGTVDGKSQEWPFNLEHIDGPLGKATVVTGSKIELGNIGGFERGDQVSYGGFIHFQGNPTGAIVAKMEPSPGFRGWDLWIEKGKIGAHIIDTWETSATKVVAQTNLKAGQWYHVMITFDGTKSGHQAASIFIDGKRVGAGPDPNTVGGSLINSAPLTLGSRSGGDSELTTKVALQDFRFYRRLLKEGEISSLANSQKISVYAALPADKRTPEQNKILFEHFVTNVDEPSLNLLQERDGIRKEEAHLRARGSASLVFEEKKGVDPFAHVLIRGDYTSQGEKVFPGTPAILPPMPEGAPKDRHGLAMWINDPTNPLPARVTMNRLWAYIFGTGIVESLGDFGIMGARPSNPKLLDWLASEFMESGWDYRHMVKTIVTSQAYRQSGTVSAEKLEKDPANILVSRGPRIRLEAEQIRDMVLASAGLLSEKTGGPPVKPYQPEGIWEAVAMPQSNTKNYKQDTGEALYRRSIYTFWKRTAAPPSMEILDAPTREVFCVGRERTNTPLQALLLMNDPQFTEANRKLAENAMIGYESSEDRIDFITRRLIGRKVDTEERLAITETFDAAADYYSANLDDAEKLITVGELPHDAELDDAQLAAWTIVASQIFNLDETITK